jgi:hypothetical protein
MVRIFAFAFDAQHFAWTPIHSQSVIKRRLSPARFFFFTKNFVNFLLFFLFFVRSRVVPLANAQSAFVNTHATLFTLCAVACRILRLDFTSRVSGHRCLQWLFAGHALTWKASVWERSADRSRSKKGKILEETHDFIDPHSDQSHSSIGFANWCANDISQVNPGEPG